MAQSLTPFAGRVYSQRRLRRLHPELARTFRRPRAHVWLIAIQIISFGGYLLYVVRFYLNLASLIAAAHCEWDNATNDRDPS